MDFLEKDLEDIIYNTPQERLRERGLGCAHYNSIFRQVRIGNYGIADIVTLYKYSRGYYSLSIYELKNKVLNPAAFWQLVRYMKGLEWFIEHKKLFKSFSIKGYLIGRSIDKSGDFCYLPCIESNISMYTYDYDFDGVSFLPVQNSYYLINHGDMDIEQFGCNTNTEFYKKLIHG